MATAKELAILISAKDAASRVLQSFSGTLGHTEDSVKKFGISARDFGKNATVMGAKLSLAAAPLDMLGLAAFNAASDMAESASKMQVVFGPASGEIATFAEGAAKNLGMSKQAATEAAGTFGNLFSAIGLGKPEMASMSTGILQLSADLASFNNLKPEEVLQKLRSGLVGEAEPMRTLGVNINEATTQAKAMELGLASVGEELTDAAKIQARYALIMEQTTLAQGDFIRTADGVANGTRIAKAQFADLQAEIGERLLPIGLKVITWVQDLMDKFGTLSSEQQTAIVVAGGLFAILGPLTTAIGLAATATGLLTAAATSHTTAMIASKIAAIAGTVATQGLTAAQWLLNAALTANPIGLVVVGLAALAAALKYAYDNSEDFRGAVNGLWERLQPLLDGLRNFLDLISQIPNNISLPSIPSINLGGGGEEQYSERTGKTYANNAIGDAQKRADEWMAGLQGRAAGGSVWPGQTYKVGEQGVELFRPSVPGTIIPNGNRGAGGNIYVTVNVQGSVISERDLATRLREQLLQLGRSNLSVGLT